MRALLVVLVLSACVDAGGGRFCPDVAVSLRDPVTGTCHVATGCDLAGDLAQDQAACVGSCSALAETNCLAAAGCRVAYEIASHLGDTSPRFMGCWGTAPSGPITGTCTGLDAQACSRHDNCTALYTQDAGGNTSFTSCGEEPARP